MNLSEARIGEDVIVKDIVTEDEELKSFLFSLGCYSGESITIVSKKRGSYVFSHCALGGLRIYVTCDSRA